MKREVKLLISVILAVALMVSVMALDGGITGAAIGIENIGVVDSQVLDALNENAEVSVIVVLKDSEEITKNQEEVLGELELKGQGIQIRAMNSKEEYDLDLKYQYAFVNGFSGDITKEGLEKLMEEDLVEKVEYDRPLKILLDESVGQINANDSWNLEFNGVNPTGLGETVCVIDTGIDYTHPNLGGCSYSGFIAGNCSKVIGGYDVADNDDNPIDLHGHGTHVAGIIASENETYRGVAPDAKLVAVKVFSGSSGSTTYGTLVAGLEWCTNTTNVALYNISVISMSIGCEGGNCTHWNTTCDASISSAAEAVNLAVAQNISVMIASGNGGWTDGISDPACLANATPIGGVSTTDDSVTFNRGNLLRLIAPGSSIVSLNLGSGTRSDSGTSMSTPHVSGAAVLLQQFNKLQFGISLTSSEIESVFDNTGKNIDDSASSGFNYSRVNVFVAITSLDIVAPSISYVAPTPDNNNESGSSVTVNVTVTETLQTVILEWNGVNETMLGSVVNFYTIKTGLEAGNYTYRVYGTDYANNTNFTELRTVVVDANPTITINNPLNNSHKTEFNLGLVLEDQNISITSYNVTNSTGEIVQENSTSVNLSSFTWTDFVDLTSGNYTLTVSVLDTIGNAVVESVNFIVDKTAPALFGEGRTPTTVYNSDTIVFTVNATDNYLDKVYLEINDSGLRNITLNLSSGNQYTTSLSNLANQLNLGYRFYAVDLAGNVNLTTLTTFTIQNRAVNTVSITSPSSGVEIEVDSMLSFTSTATDPDNDVLNYSWDFADGATANTQDTSHTYNSTGNFTVTLNVSDNYGTSLTDSLTVVVVDDLVGPTITTTFNSEVHLERDDAMTLTVVANDASGIFNLSGIFSGVYALVGNATFCDDLNATAKSCAWRITFKSEDVGTHNFMINATDNSANKYVNSKSYTVNFASCSDSSENGDETGVDCGGSCGACATTDDDSSSSAAAAGGSGGGGGGGSGGGSIATATSTDDPDESTSSTTPPTATPGTPAESVEESSETSTADYIITSLENEFVDIPIENDIVKKISIKTKAAGEISLNVESFTEKPADVLELENVYQYLKIDFESDSNESELSQALITFVLPADQNFSSQKITLNHYHNDKWKKLKTKKINQTYQAKTDSFSYFAITSKERFSFTNWVTGAASTFLPSQGGGKNLTLIVMIVFVIILGMVYFFVRDGN